MPHEKLKIIDGHAIRYPTSMEARDNWKLRHVSRVLHATRNIERTRKKVTRTFSVSSNWNFGENSWVCVYIYIYTRCPRSFDSPCIRFHQFRGRQWNVDCHWPDKIFCRTRIIRRNSKVFSFKYLAGIYL